MGGNVYLPVAFGIALALCSVLIIRNRRLKSQEKKDAGLIRVLRSEVCSRRRACGELQTLESERSFFTAFLREVPRLVNELRGDVPGRQIPRVLLEGVKYIFGPGQAVILLRRRQAASEEGHDLKLVVAAIANPHSSIKTGVEIHFGEGKVGFVASAQKIMTRQDFAKEPSDTRFALKLSDTGGFDADLYGPMVFEGETLGVIVLFNVSQRPDLARGALRVLCQIGALALHNALRYRKLKISSQVDGLTRIYNKSHVTQTLSEKIIAASERISPLSIFLFDIDHFKTYNDSHGHDAGDALLKELVRLVGENTRDIDIFGRFGGEEFLLILPETEMPQALAVAEKIRSKVADHPFASAESQPLGCISISGGVAAYPRDSMDSAGLLRAADSALYEAKREGRNRACAATVKELGGAEAITPDRRALENALENVDTSKKEKQGPVTA